MQIDSATRIVTVSHEPPGGGSPQPHQEAGCSGCRQKRGSHRATIIGASIGGLVLLLIVAGGDPSTPLNLNLACCLINLSKLMLPWSSHLICHEAVLGRVKTVMNAYHHIPAPALPYTQT